MAAFHSHRIKRLVLELRGLREKDAREMQDRMGQLYHSQIIPLLDRYLTQLSPNGRPLRIEKLELDLGRIDADELESAIVKQLEDQLRRQTPGLISEGDEQKDKAGEHRDGVAEDPQRELFQYFIQTGSLPWWSERASANPVLDSLNFLIAERPEWLRSAMRQWIERGNYLRRMLRQLPPEALLRLAGLQINLTPASFSKAAENFFNLIGQLSASLHIPTSRLREEAWLKLLQIAFSQPAPASDALSFWQEWLLQLAVVFRISYEQFLRVLQKEIAGSTPHPGADLPAILDRLAKNGINSDFSSAGRRFTGQGLVTDLDRLLEGNDQWSASEKALLKKAMTAANSMAFSSSEVQRLALILAENEKIRFALIELWRSALQELAAIPGLPSGLYRELVSGLNNLRHDRWAPAEISDLLGLIAKVERYRETANRADRSGAFSQIDELFVENAGLVILWPFLPRFFQSLDLLEDKQFVDRAAAHRAAGLLQYLADGRPEPPEYLLGFNKVFCGLEWDEVHDFGGPVTETEAGECELLLQAVIANAPILKNMTPDGFRGTFLLRKGMLRSRADAWELHVEKESYDVVLGQFPWSWKVVKPPWLERPILVEWGK